MHMEMSIWGDCSSAAPMDEPPLLKGCTKALICGAQEQAVITNYTRFKIDKTIEFPFFKMRGSKNETVSHIISEYNMLR